MRAQSDTAGTNRDRPSRASGRPWRVGRGLFLILAAAVLLASSLAPGCAKKGKQRLFVVGLDGATWDLLDPWIAAGDLPNLKAFRDASSWGTMNSVIPYLSPAAWTSAVTGVNPGRHGIFDFQRRLPGQSMIVTETSKSRRSPPVWNLLKGQGRKVAVINVPMTDPPDVVDGVMVAGFPHLDAEGYAYPGELQARCKEMGYILDHMELTLPEGQEEKLLSEIKAARDKRWELVKQLYSEDDYDLFWVVFTGTDRVQHLFWKFDDPENPHYDPAEASRLAGTMHDFWVEQDRILGELFAMIRPGTWVLVLSDHGFGPIRRELRVGNWLHSPESGFSEEETQDVFILDYTDGARLYVRQPGRDPSGRLNDAERASVRGRLASGLAAVTDPATGQKPVEAVYPAEQVFVGKYAEKGPDLTLLPSFSYFIHWGDRDTGFKLPCCGDILSTLSGWHRMNGMFMLQGPGVKAGRVEVAPSLLDVTPTCLYLLGSTLPEDFDGGIMSASLQDSWIKRHPEKREGRLTEEDRPMTPEEQRALKNLPYIGK